MMNETLTVGAGFADEVTMRDLDSNDECVPTFDQVREELELIERKLAERYHLRKQVRRKLLEMHMASELDDDDLAMNWREAYSLYLDWADEWTEREPEQKAVPPPKAQEDKPQEAADAASLLLWLYVALGFSTVSRHAPRPQTGTVPKFLLSGVA
jgi:hypothetical protein